MNTKKLTTYTLNTFIGLLFLLFFISLGLHVALYCRPIYYSGIDELSKSTGYSADEIKLNYDTLIDYCSPFFKGELKFPTLPASESGISHFAEVKNIFTFFSALLVICPILLVILILIQRKRKVSSYLLTSPGIMIILPVVVITACAINFKAAFKLFHKIMFRNNDWIFDPVTDPIINLLPHSFFMNCTLILFISILSGCALILIAYIIKTLHSQSQ